MADFNLNESNEYLQIKEKQQSIYRSVSSSSSSDILSSIAAIIPAFVSNIQKSGISMLSSAGPAESQAKRESITNALFTPQFLETRAAALKNDVTRDYGLLYSLSNYSFSPFIFQIDCETEELKKFRSLNQPNEDSRFKISRINRRKAEESYRNGQFDEAIRQFKESEEKNDTDYTTQYQLGLIYFFEKADYNEACTYFKKAARFSQNKSPIIFLCSTVYFALLLRLFGTCTRNASLLDEAHAALMNIYNANSNSPFINYALVQSCVSISSRSGYASTARDLVKRLIKTNEFTALQMVYDAALDSFLPQIGEVITDLIIEAKNSAADIFKQIEESVERVTHMSKYMGNSTKLAAVKNEYRQLQGRLNIANYFELKDVESQAKKILESFQALFREVNENRAYFELREIAEAALKEFRSDEIDIKKPLASLEDDLKAAGAELEKLEKTYPPDREEQYIKKNVVIKGKVEVIEQKVEASVSWKKQKVFLFLKSIIGCLFALLVVMVIICIFLFLKMEISVVTYMVIAIFLLFTPLYGTIGGEVFYFNVEMKRKKFIEKIDKFTKMIEIKRPRVEEDIQKLKEKYAAVISEKSKLSKDTSMQILEASIRGNFEQIKRFLT